jgi:hypothetical protein
MGLPGRAHGLRKAEARHTTYPGAAATGTFFNEIRGLIL